MRVLAIRGANLASLEGRFELDLAEGALARAGVFAICGPTGAGKTTLLDAMCLALFDTAPRLDASRRVRTGTEADDERLTTRDPRTILRKGAGRGWAEVDFEGVDGHRYRARWEVHRAREKADGKIQSSAMKLQNLETEERWGGRKTHVKVEIERRLGLSFDQFRRSVLLAQGDFAAFLDADPRERADLLERMTGTAIYGAISQEAHARANEEARRFDFLGEQLRAVPELSDEERTDLEEKLAALAIRAREDELAALNANAALRWHHELEGLKREERAAREDRQQTLQQLALAETKRHELAAWEAALPLRPFLDAVDQAERTLARREGELAGTRDRARGARLAVQEATRAAAEARAALEGASVDRERSRELVEKARALDRRIAEREEAHAALVAAEREAEAALSSAEAARAELREQITAAEADVERARAWLADNPAAAALEADWGRSQEHLDRVVELSEQLAPLESARPELSAAHASAERELAAAEGQHLGLALRAREVRREHDALRERALAEPSSAVAEESRRWSARRTALETLIGVADRAQQAQEARARQLTRAEQARAAVDTAIARAKEQRDARALAHAKLEEALAQRDRVRATLDLTERRADLVSGEPCPLCGSESHPYAHEVPVMNALLEQADARAKELRDALSAYDAGIAEAGQQAESEREDVERAERDAATWGETLREARERYRQAARELDGPWPDELPEAPMPAPSSDEGVDWGPLFSLVSVSEAPEPGVLLSESARDALHEARDVAARELRAATEQERSRREREQTLEALRVRLEDAREAEAGAREALEAARAAEGRASEAVARSIAEGARLEGERARSVDKIASVLDGYEGWRARLLAEPATLASELRDAVAARRTWLELERRGLTKMAEHRPALEGANVEHREAGRSRDKARAARDAAASQLEATRAERRAVLGGSSADEAEARSTAGVTTAREGLERAEERLQAAHREDAEQAARAERAGVAVIEAQVALKDVGDALTSSLEDAGLERDAATARLKRDPREMEAFRAELRRLDERRAEQTAVLAERERKREAHEQTDPPSMDAEAAKVALTDAQRRLTETQELLVAARSRLESDARHREQAKRLRLAMADQLERLETWTTLNDLIGSANGNKLRVFAQSLTLELLLEHANLHLRDLAPRYGLVRIPGEDLALQVVDHEMGDEVRAVTSLSGGESFLVALGLALGLASLSSQQARVDSLFIDEGFGALDPASLELVLATLDLLQASGRQVGLISHVPAVAERFDTRVQVVAAGPARSKVELIEGVHALL